MSEPHSRRSWRIPVAKRRLVQAGSLVFSNAAVLSVLRFLPCSYLQCSNCAISTFSCPLILVQRGAVFASMGLVGMMPEKILGSVAVALAIVVFFGAAAGAWSCGWLCPFGFLQDLLHKIPVPKFRLPGWSGHLRLPLFLVLLVAVPYATTSLFFCDVCPSGTINRLWQQAAGIPLDFAAPQGMLALFSLAFLAAVVILAAFALRPFCSLLCPIGGVLGLFNRFSGYHLAVDRERCVDCGRCRSLCPQGLDPAATPGHGQCNLCLECTRACRFIAADLRL